jgi:hypothetical protein
MRLLHWLKPNSGRRYAEWHRRLSSHWEPPKYSGDWYQYWDYWSADFSGMDRRANRRRLPDKGITLLRAAAEMEKTNPAWVYVVAAIPVLSTPETLLGPGSRHVEQGQVVVTVAEGYVLAWRRVPNGWRASDDPEISCAPVAELMDAVHRLGLTPA